MGWITFNKSKNITPKDYFKTVFNWGEKLELLHIETKNRVAYMAVRNKEKGYVSAYIYLLTYAPKSYYNFGYKGMSEFAGPNVYNCSKKLINLLTPLEEIAKIDNEDINDCMYQWAMNWRNNCLNNLKNNTNKPFSEGKIIKLEFPLNFNRIGERQFFKKMDRKIYAVEIEQDEVRIISRVKFNPKNYNYTFVN